MKTPLTLLLSICCFALCAQPIPPNPTPLGFTEILIGAGIIYGLRQKMRKKN